MTQLGTIHGMFSGNVAEILAKDGRPLITAIRKVRTGSGFLGMEGLQGDTSAEADHHTNDKALHLYAEENYPLVEARLGVTLPKPAFGENITATGIREEHVYVGDHYEIGEAIICVTQPTERCKTVGRSLGLPKILKVLHELEICGFYARVIRPGLIVDGTPIILRQRFQSAWSIKRLHQLMFNGLGNDKLVEEAMDVECLSTEWKKRAEIMRGRLQRGEPLSSNLAG